ncbi:hypothetical protein SAMN05216267_10413 [Actinacidiphila rubida]|uniref:Uncharacterized protein n=1 Tax=Actinacidiphila rubida TaxID=310780 RepID=A0A1H8SCB3_9ACTN|nr:hypothetical protein SAMN05216267_10413 [Actinacidiphila rubida]
MPPVRIGEHRTEGKPWRSVIVTGDRFRLGPALEEGVLLLGRVAWQLFARIRPGRQDPCAARPVPGNRNDWTVTEGVADARELRCG